MNHHDRYRAHEPRVRTSLQRVAPSTSNADEFRDKAAKLWREFGIIVIWPDQFIPWDMRAVAENAARKLYGDKQEDG